jgi:hypothetical protein
MVRLAFGKASGLVNENRDTTSTRNADRNESTVRQAFFPTK